MKQSFPETIFTSSKTLGFLLAILLTSIIKKTLQGGKLKVITRYSINFFVNNLLFRYYIMLGECCLLNF